MADVGASEEAWIRLMRRLVQRGIWAEAASRVGVHRYEFREGG